MKKNKADWKHALRGSSVVFNTPTWLTNGHFLVRLEDVPDNVRPFVSGKFLETFVGNDFLTGAVLREDASLGAVISSVERTAVKEWTVSGIVVKRPEAVDVRLLYGDDGIACLAEHYVELLGVCAGEVWYAADPDSAFYDAREANAVRKVIMSVRVDGIATDPELRKIAEVLHAD